MPIFYDDVTKILKPEIPHVTMPYIDDVPINRACHGFVNPHGYLGMGCMGMGMSPAHATHTQPTSTTTGSADLINII